MPEARQLEISERLHATLRKAMPKIAKAITDAEMKFCIHGYRHGKPRSLLLFPPLEAHEVAEESDLFFDHPFAGIIIDGTVNAWMDRVLGAEAR